MTKRLFNLDLDNGVVCDPRAYLPRSWRKEIKGQKGFSTLKLELSATQWLLYLDLEFAGVSIKGLLFINLELLKWRSKVFSTPIWTVETTIKGLLYSNLELLKWQSKVFYTPIWSCCNGNQRSSLLQSRMLKWQSKVLFFNLDSWNGDQRSSLLRSGLLKFWSKVFSTLIWSCWSVDPRLLYFDLEFVEMSI